MQTLKFISFYCPTCHILNLALILKPQNLRYKWSNRILWSLPFLVICVTTLANGEIGGTSITLTVGLVIWYSYLTYDFVQLNHKRVQAASNSKLIVAEPTEPSTNYMGLKLKKNENGLDLFQNLNFKLHIDKSRQLLEYDQWGQTKKIKTSQIEFLMLEFLTFTNATYHVFGKSYWVINILAKLQNRNSPLRLVEIKNSKNNAWEQEEDNPDDEKRYFEKGHDLIKVLSLTIDKPYKIIDEEKIKNERQQRI